MATKITIEKHPFEGSAKADFAVFETNETTEKGLIEEFSKAIKELGWYKCQEDCFSCTGEFSACGTSIAEGVTNDT